ncbi:MAG TPA: N-acetyl-gamma-glutamyl-phosphate reductase [Elusimicrobiota bacterium]|jgi:N-acetyl-gamma-glutamyl-phosphate reductase|nr:N-acetyl-gamma-glutamyl-phosphate reductase [Elusimicrobiota bacterium]
MKRSVGILGGGGYVGGELVRLLMSHPKVELAAVASATYAGKPVSAAHPNLRGLTSLKFEEKLPAGLDAVFLALGHGESMAESAKLAAGKGPAIVDLSGDFRLRDSALYPVWYGREHSSPALLPSFTYGLTELAREQVAKAKRVANPGCIATATALALGPLARLGLAGTAHVTAVTGSSGSGAKPSATTHHPLREGNMRAYKALAHQHAPEVEQLFDDLAGKESLRLGLVAVSGPFVRGIYCVAQLELPKGVGAEQVKAAFQETYGKSTFVRLLDAPPDLNAVVGSNFCDIHAAVQGRRVAVISALDNLVKGAAGQAVQNFNVMMGWGEAEGLLHAGVYP